MKYWLNISVLKSVSPCQILVIEKLSIVTMSYVGNTIRYVIMKKKKKERKEKKRKENLQESEQNVVGVKEIAQGKFHSCCSEWIRMVYLATEYNLGKSHIRLSRLYFCLVSHPLPG